MKIVKLIIVPMVLLSCSQNKHKEKLYSSTRSSDEEQVSHIASCVAGAQDSVVEIIKGVKDAALTAAIGYGGVTNCLYGKTYLIGSQEALRRCEQATEFSIELQNKIIEAAEAIKQLSKLFKQFSSWWVDSSTLNQRIEIGCKLITNVILSYGTFKVVQLAKEASYLNMLLKHHPRAFAATVIMSRGNEAQNLLLMKTILANISREKVRQTITTSVSVIAPQVSGTGANLTQKIIQDELSYHKLDPNQVIYRTVKKKYLDASNQLIRPNPKPSGTVLNRYQMTEFSKLTAEQIESWDVGVLLQQDLREKPLSGLFFATQKGMYEGAGNVTVAVKVKDIIDAGGKPMVDLGASSRFDVVGPPRTLFFELPVDATIPYTVVK